MISSGSHLRPSKTALAGYGYLTKTGYFVWNREKHRYRTGQRPRASEVPLFSAHHKNPREPKAVQRRHHIEIIGPDRQKCFRYPRAALNGKP